MSIWFNKHLKLEDLSVVLEGTMAEHLGMEWVALGDDFLKMKMPVDHRTKQPYGLLHGGASCTLSETVGSIASHLVVDANKFSCVGLEINANHIRSARQGFVTGIATPLHLGTNTHVWDVKIYDDAEKLICATRLTVAVLKKAF
ncbi:hotdog fold thioesterase [Ferruginibacter lapsinanis]|uniref:hotdog fold thioesterase n=1 Tax=Ferruginibacter lapsinanis TaxID=563172 RepID=UPI001E4CD59D|nr:hotdog fold thioesterase [Ferruginibacter lapsinanis]UEG49594.1 hotdog fold thioesterase [Ferruginibacter lapsinanis]